jgi:hypothetical protein
MEGARIWPASDLGQLPALNAALEAKLADMPLVMEDKTVISSSNPFQPEHDPQHAEQITRHLKLSLNSLIFRLFGPLSTPSNPLRVRWIEAFFPFTTPSYEVEVWWNGEWLELLGCGVVMQKTLDQAGESILPPCSAPLTTRHVPQIWLGIRPRSRASLYGPLPNPRYPPLLVRGRAVYLPVSPRRNKRV